MENRFEAGGYRLSASEAAQELRSGRVLILVDSLQGIAVACQALQFLNEETLAALNVATNANISVVLAGERVEALQLPLFPGSPLQEMEPALTLDVHGKTTAGQVSIDVHMMRALIDPLTTPTDVVQPGRLRVVRSYPGGILKRRGMPEAASDLLRIAGLEPGALIGQLDSCADETNARLQALAEQWGSGIIALEDIIRYRKEHRASLITETLLPTSDATFRLRHYQEIETGKAYLALLLGDIAHTAQSHEAQLKGEDHAPQTPLVRLHSACATGDIFGSQRCDCQAQLHAALQKIVHEKRGVLLYLPQEGRGIGLAGKLQAYALQEQGFDTLEANLHLGYPADARDYTLAVEILRDLGLNAIRLMSNNPEKSHALSDGGILVENVPLETAPNANNLRYLQTKLQRMGHLLTTIQQKVE